MGLLRGNTLSWATAVWEQQSLITNSNAAFTTEMKRVFDHLVDGKDASEALLSLCQGMRSVAEYSIEFRTLAAERGLNSEALRATFCNVLNQTLKDELVSEPEPTDLEGLYALVIQINNHLHERKKERQQHPFAAPLAATAPTVPVSRLGQNKDSTAQQPPKKDTPPEPMQLGRFT